MAERIGAWDMYDDELKCTLCGECPETLLHLLLLCPFSRAIWSESRWQLNSVVFGDGTVADWVQIILRPHQAIGVPLEDQHFFQIFALNAIDLTWVARNQLEHNGKFARNHCQRLLSRLTLMLLLGIILR